MSIADVATFVAAVPKVELHVHLIGSASIDTVLALARRHPDGGVPTDPDDLAQALADARARALAVHNLELAWVFDADAALGPAGAEQTVDFALGHRPPGTVGIGLGGAEAGVSRAEFARAFRRARDGGLHSVPHAGETVGPGEVWAAVRELGAERIGHGLGAARDPALLAHLAERGITLEICPTSNLRTSAVPTLDEHPLPAILAAGVRGDDRDG